MYKKTHLIQSSLLFIAIFASLTCSKVSESISKNISVPSKIEYKFKNSQLFIKIALEDDLNKERSSYQWALLDSSATENLLVDIDSERTSFVIWQDGKHRLKQIFRPLGDFTPSDYKIILGQPFFRANCIILNRGVPEFLEPNNKKNCPMLPNTGLNSGKSSNTNSKANSTDFSKWCWIPLLTKKGQMILNVEVNGIAIEFALDTGSGMTAVPGSLMGDQIFATSKKVNVLYTFGEQKKQIVYSIAKPIHLTDKLKFFPNEVLDSEQVWADNYEYFPTLGMDFFRTFRVYIDFGSKSIGIEDHEQ